MNKTLKLLINRASCRTFTKKKVSPAALASLFEAGIHAPTGGNLQPYSIIKIEKAAATARLAKLCGQSFLKKAPLHLIFCIDFHRLKRWAKLQEAPFSAERALRPFWIAFQDTIICAQSICTAADALGLGSVYIGPIFDRISAIREMCRLPKGVIPVVSLAMGYPSIFPGQRKKLGPGIVVHNEVYRDIPAAQLLSAFDEKYKDARKEITAKDLKSFYGAVSAVHGRKFAQKCVTGVKARKYFNKAQVYFGLHYRADKMLFSTPKHFKMLSRAGLACFDTGK
ncbi:MAG: nitroreductase family protein [Elusimicrobia bacterium]|nr:nitroreductase family protein [Elusimicrobiota bacterium]